MSSIATAAMVIDEFDGASLDARWSVTNPAYNIGGGKLYLTAGAWYAGPTARNFYTANVGEGLWTATLKIDNFEPTASYTQIDIYASTADRQNYVRGGYVYDMWGYDANHRGITLVPCTNGAEAYGSVPQPTVNFGTDMFYIRVSKISEYSAVFSYSTDGLNFVNAGTLSADPGAKFTEVGFFAGSNMSSTPIVATVDSITVTPEPATMSLLALGGIAALLRRRSR